LTLTAPPCSSSAESWKTLPVNKNIHTVSRTCTKSGVL
jgi:hypothetical protein